MVCPRLSDLRRPFSKGSSSTTRRFTAMDSSRRASISGESGRVRSSEKRGSTRRRTDESVFEHLGKSRQEMFARKAGKKSSGYQHGFGRRKGSDFIFQTVEVNTGLSAHGSIDGPQERSGEVEIADTPLEGSGGKSTQVGNHASSEVYHDRTARGMTVAQRLPHRGKRLEGLMGIVGFDADKVGRGQFVLADRSGRNWRRVFSSVRRKRRVVGIAFEYLVERGRDVGGKEELLKPFYRVVSCEQMVSKSRASDAMSGSKRLAPASSSTLSAAGRY